MQTITRHEALDQVRTFVRGASDVNLINAYRLLYPRQPRPSVEGDAKEGVVKTIMFTLDTDTHYDILAQMWTYFNPKIYGVRTKPEDGSLVYEVIRRRKS